MEEALTGNNHTGEGMESRMTAGLRSKDREIKKCCSTETGARVFLGTVRHV